MPDVEGTLEFIANIPLYESEKPYFILPLEGSGIVPGVQKVSNIEFDEHTVQISDARGKSFSLDRNGFQVVKHSSKALDLKDVDTVTAYKSETEVLLQKIFPDAERVVTWDLRLRKNMPLGRTSFDMNDPLLVEGPARGVHYNTVDSGPAVISRYLSEEDKDRYCHPGFRFRIINTWRSLVHNLEDRPLTVCDFQSTNMEDLMPADRVYPQRVGEVYYMRYNPAQKWYWLSNQSPDEPYVMMMYDSIAGPQARYCPHISFKNPLARPDAPIRESVETRTIVVSKI